MLDGVRRGEMIAYELGQRVCLLPGGADRSTLAILAMQVHQSLTVQGYAHIDPVEGFIESFVHKWTITMDMDEAHHAKKEGGGVYG